LVKEQTTALLCTHVYHAECIDAYCQARNTDIVSIPCPLCKRAGLSLVEDGGSLSDANDTGPESDDVIVMPAPGAAASSSGVPPPEPRIVVDDDGTMLDTGLPPPTEANESEDEEAEAAEEEVHDREPAVTPKAKAKAKAETKSKAKARAETKSKAKAAAKAEAASVDEPSGAVEPTPAATIAIAKANAKSKAKAGAKAKAGTKSDDVIVMPAPGAAASSSGVPHPEPRIVVDDDGTMLDTGLPPPTEKNESEDEDIFDGLFLSEAAEEEVHDREPSVTLLAKARARAKAETKSKARAETKSKAKAGAKAKAESEVEPGGAAEPTPAATTAIALLPTPKAPEFQVAQLFQGLAMCDTCQAYQPFDKVRVKSKSQQIFRCNACHSKQCTLRRAFGRWPTEAFLGLDQDKQTAFWQSLTSLSGRNMITKVSETLSNYEECAETFFDGGEYLPLSALFGNSDLRRRVRKQRGALTNR
jgi:hypothetical protein